MEHAWPRIQALLEQGLSPGLYKVWIKPLQAVVSGSALEIEAPNDFVACWVRDRLIEQVSQAAAEVLGGRPTVTVAARKAQPAQAVAPAAAAPAGGAASSAPSRSRIEVPSAGARAEHLGLPIVPRPRILQYTGGQPGQGGQNWRFSFDDFIVGPSNELAFAAATGLCRQTLASEQLFICSGSGLGKTHLLQAIGRDLAASGNRNPRIVYATAEEFATQMVMAIKAREVETFKAQFRENVDLLLLEDIHFFQGKERMQDELVSTLKALRARGSKVVFTSSFLPRDLANVDSQLVSRFCAGFMTVIEKPDFATRVRIVRQKAARSYRTLISEDVSSLLAERIQSDIRQLESCLQNLIIKAQLLGKSITMDMAWDVLRNYGIEGDGIGRPSIDKVLDFVCKCYSLSLDQLRSKSRKRDLVLARNTAFYLARKHTDMSLKDIGCRFNRSHSTVLKGITNVEIELSKKTPLGRQLERTMDRLTS